MNTNGLQTAIDDHGEVHMVVEEYDGEIEVRKGQYSLSDGVLRLEGPDYVLTVDTDSIVSWYKPMNLYH